MSRTHKKCLIASGALHVLLLIILLVTPAFLVKEEPPVDQTVLTLVSTEVTSQPAVITEPTPPPPQPEPEPDPPREQPQPKKADPPKPPVRKPDPPKEKKPVEQPKEVIKEPEVTPAPKKKIEYTKPESINFSDTIKSAPQQPKRKTVDRDTLDEILKPSSTTQISEADLKPVPKISGYSGDTYSSVVRGAYYRNWNPPNNVTANNKSVTVRVVILRDGTVKSATILKKSGSSALNASIINLIKKQVTKMPQPFPPNARDDERTYDIEFNLNQKFNG